MTNITLWERSRRVNKQYDASKRHLINANKRQNSTYYHLEAACKRYMAMQSQVIGHLEIDQLDDVQEAYNRFRRAKLDHDAARKELTDAFADFKKIEIAYSKVIFKGFRQIGTKMTTLAKVFGFTSSTMSRWLNSDEEELSEYYDKEFGGC